jgi:hypothetical protein
MIRAINPPWGKGTSTTKRVAPKISKIMRSLESNLTRESLGV